MATIASNVEGVRAEIAAACAAVGRDPSSVRLIAVTKSVGPEALATLAAAGVLDFGENRVDHLARMASAAPAGARFHHIGRIQGRQVPAIVAHAAAVHGLADADHARRLARVAEGRERPLPVYLQVNVSGEASKAGVVPSGLGALLTVVRSLPALAAVGLMTMAPALGEGVDEGVVSSCFKSLADLARSHGVPRTSMGMSGDFALAIRCGATDVRVGSRLFA
jgi:pyridoxal phosphate enzyme (YggS family)